jgi:exosortase E/protease (VPEID-CTERM system)
MVVVRSAQAAGWLARRFPPRALRWALPGALLAVEFLALSLLVDLPTGGPALPLVEALRMAVPVVLGAVAAGWLLGRDAGPRVREAVPEPPPWRPFPALAVQPVAFAATAAYAHRLLGPGATPAPLGALATWLAGAAATALLAIASAAPLGWTAREVVRRWRTPLVALALGVLAWRAAAAAEGLWGVLSGGTLRAVAALLRWTAGRVTLDPADGLIGLDGFEVLVAPICSGVDGLGLVLLFQATWISMARTRLRPWRALLLLPLGAVAALGANVLRITLLILVGASGHEDLALGGFHSKLGWLLFAGLALGSVALAERVRWLRRPDGDPATSARGGVPETAAAYLGPLLAALAAALVTGMWSDGPLDRAYGLRIAAGALALVLLGRSLPAPALALRGAGVPIAIGAATCVFWVAVAGGGLGGAELARELAQLSPAGRWAWIAVRAAGSVLFVPLAEELAFRGFLLPWLVSPEFERVPPRAWTWPAVLLSSLAFGALHASWALGTFAGLAFAAARLWRGRIGDAVLAHATCNAGVALAVLAGGRWGLWS